MANNRSRSFSKQQRPDVSKSPPSKNLAHVPCKFFKQGACQAGNTCPFSHQLDSNADSAPCKYFQKGNCKFGAKCALAHILPDGRRVNPKSLAQVYQNHNVSSSHHSQSQGNGHSEPVPVVSAPAPPPPQSAQVPSVSATVSVAAATAVPQPQPQAVPTATRPVQIVNNSVSSNGFFGVQNVQSPTRHQQPPMLSPPSSFNATNVTMDTTSPTFPGFASRVGSLPINNTSTHPRTMSSTTESMPFGSQSIWSTSATQNYRSVSHSGTVKPTFHSPVNSHTLHENAIMDDDEGDEMFEEDFVPSSLSDLLTPQELQRRGSRSSFSRPSMVMGMRPNVVWETADAVVGETMDQDENEMQFKMDDDEFYETRVAGLRI